MPHASGTVIDGYEIEEELNRGAFANAYRARKSGRLVFLKEYKSPKPTVAWYPAYVEYQSTLKRRVESTILKDFVCGMYEFFEATDPPRHSPHSKKFYQAHEFVTGGKDLAKIVEEIEKRGDHPWPRRLTFARVLMASIARLHEQKIVHCDLKPENVILIPDPSIGAGYRLKLIDLDFSLLADQRAPWHGIQGYVQTPGWGSPEHVRCEVPTVASDVFTCGLILYELLAGGNPYEGLGEAEYGAHVLTYEAPPPKLADRMPSGNDAEVAKILHRCLDPKASDRPTAAQVNQALIGTTTAKIPLPPPVTPKRAKPAAPTAPPTAVTPAAPKPAPAPAPAKAPAPAPAPKAPPKAPAVAAAGCLVLVTADGQRLEFRTKTVLNQAALGRLGPDAKVWDPRLQLTLEPRADGWYVVPNPAAPNDTLVNGAAVTTARRLSTGDVLAVGRAAKKIVRAPMTVEVA